VQCARWRGPTDSSATLTVRWTQSGGRLVCRSGPRAPSCSCRPRPASPKLTTRLTAGGNPVPCRLHVLHYSAVRSSRKEKSTPLTQVTIFCSIRNQSRVTTALCSYQSSIKLNRFSLLRIFYFVFQLQFNKDSVSLGTNPCVVIARITSKKVMPTRTIRQHLLIKHT
jgi:hypothetical protein